MTDGALANLIPAYDAVLLDAYGVLVDHDEALPGARELLDQLRAADTPFFIVTNDASRLPATIAARLGRRGLKVTAEQVISSGSLLCDTFTARGLAGARCVVLGPEDSQTMVREAGGQVVPAGEDADAVVLCDEIGYPFIETVDAVLTLLYRRFADGAPPRLILPNPDLIYPKSGERYGFATGAIALMFEAALRQRFPGRTDAVFERLGKPQAAIFDEARRRAGGGRLLMVGDQLSTDIRGANAAGIDSALVLTGLDTVDETTPPSDRPTYQLTALV